MQHVETRDIAYKTAPNRGTAERNTISRVTLLGKACEVEKMTRFLKEIDMFEET